MENPRKVIKAWKEPLILGMVAILEVKVVCEVFSSNMHIFMLTYDSNAFLEVMFFKKY
jgi:hypothetical protein